MNVGISEQNMVSVAAGFALEGFIPYVTTRAPFLSMRAAEQIRTAVCYDNLTVRFVGTGAGYCSGPAGATHWALEDVAILSGFGGMTVFETGDSVLIRKILEKSHEWNYPMYIRLGKDTEEVIYGEDTDISIGGSCELYSGEDGYFLVSGTTVLPAIKASAELKNQGISIGVIDMYSIKPFDEKAVYKAAHTGNIIVAQDHNRIGGLGSLVASFMMEQQIYCKFKVLGCPDHFVPIATSDYLYHKFEYDQDGLVRNMRDMIYDGKY